MSDSIKDRYYIASHWQLIRRKFFKHKLAIVGAAGLIILYTLALFAEFFSTYDIFERHPDYAYAPPQRIHIFHKGRLSLPFVYYLQQTLHPDTLREIYTEDKSQRFPIRLFVRGPEYKAFGAFKARLRLFGVEQPGVLFLFGTDSLGRDMYSRILHASRISLSIGLVGVAISFVLGCIIGGVAGYFAGAVDMIIMRFIEFLGGIPTLPLWLILSAAVPNTWSPIRIYFGITVILSIIGWTGLARTVRGKLLQLKVEEYVLAAKLAGAKEMYIITRHLLPGFTSYLIVSITLGIPGTILGETALSYLGLGLRSPVVSWGVMLQQAQNIRTVVINPWLMIPALFVIVVVLCYNFVGDGLRDAADPYK